MTREYPDSPIAGVAAVVFSGGMVLLVRRGNEPSRGRWGLPGGVVELGERVEEAVVREIREETGVTVRPIKLLTVLDSIVRDVCDNIRYHYILCEYLCEAVEGDPHAATDVSDALWAPLEDLGSMDMTWGTRRFIEKVLAGDYHA